MYFIREVGAYLPCITLVGAFLSLLASMGKVDMRRTEIVILLY